MEGTVPARLTRAEGRRFGLTLGIAFTVLAAIVRWRGAGSASLVLGVLALLLMLGALIAPDRLGPVERIWMRFAHLLSRITTPVFLGIVFFLLFTPFGLVRRAMGKNALVRRASDPELAPGGFWFVRGAGKRQGDMRRQF